MEKSAPLTELFKIAASDFETAEKIASLYPAEKLYLGPLMEYANSENRAINTLALCLIREIDLKNLNILELKQCLSSVNVEVGILCRKLLIKHFRDELDYETLVYLAKTSSKAKRKLVPIIIEKYQKLLNCDDLFLLYDKAIGEDLCCKIREILDSLPNKKVSLRKLKFYSYDSDNVVTDEAMEVAISMCLYRYANRLDLPTLLYFLKSTSEDQLDKVIGLIRNYPEEKIYCSHLLESLINSSNQLERDVSFELADKVLIEKIDFDKVIKYLEYQHSGSTDLVLKFLLRLPAEKLKIEKLHDYRKYLYSRNLRVVTRVLLEKFSDVLLFEDLKEMWSYGLGEFKNQTATIILDRFSDKAKKPLLTDFSKMSNKEISKKAIDLIIFIDKMAEEKAASFFIQFQL